MATIVASACSTEFVNRFDPTILSSIQRDLHFPMNVLRRGIWVTVPEILPPRLKVGRAVPARRGRATKPARFGHLQTFAARWGQRALPPKHARRMRPPPSPLRFYQIHR